VLLALFSRTPTVIFLSVTVSLIAFLYLLINVVEKNVDFAIPGATARQLQKEGLPSYEVLVEAAAIATGHKSRSSVSTAVDHTDAVASSLDSRSTLLRRTSFRGQLRKASRPSIQLDSTHRDPPATDPPSTSNSFHLTNSTTDIPTYERNPFTVFKAGPSGIANSSEPYADHGTGAMTRDRLPPTWMEWTKHPNDPRTWPKPVRRAYGLWQSVSIIPRFKRKIPLSSPWVVIALPFAYASLGVST
jgi:hypothetical protein